MKRLIPFLSAGAVILGLTHSAMAGPAAALEQPAILDLTPLASDAMEQDSNAYRGVDTPVREPIARPQTRPLLERTGLDPEIDASATDIGASQRIEVGGQQLPETRTIIQPYVELGAAAERRQDAALLARNGLDADVSAQIGGGATVSVNDQIDLRLGYTREEPLGSAALTGEPEDKVESGLSIKF